MSIQEKNAEMRRAYHDAGYTGKNVVFAVLDTGVNAVGPLRGKVTGDADGADHGTFTASVIHEYCPDAQIWAYRCDTPNAMIEAMEDVLPDMKVIIEGGDGSQVQQLLPLEPFGGTDSTNTSETEAAENGE